MIFSNSSFLQSEKCKTGTFTGKNLFCSGKNSLCEDGQDLILANIFPIITKNCGVALAFLSNDKDDQICVETLFSNEKKWIKKFKRNGLLEKAKEICSPENQERKRKEEEKRAKEIAEWKKKIKEREENQRRRVPKNDFNLICERKRDSSYGYGARKAILSFEKEKQTLTVGEFDLEKEQNFDSKKSYASNPEKKFEAEIFKGILSKTSNVYATRTYGLAIQRYDNRYSFIDKDDEPVNGAVLVTIHRDSLKTYLNGILTNTSLDYNCKITSKQEINSYHKDFEERASIFNKKRDEKLRNKI